MKQFRALCLLMALLIAVGAIPAAAENNEAPRTYFPYPSELEQLADNFSLPDPFQFFNASADPNGSGTVDSPEEWPARAAELKDMLQYYLYGNRMDPLKEDTQIVSIERNYQLDWADGIMQGVLSYFGYTEAPNLPDGAAEVFELDFSAWGMGKYYSVSKLNDDYVHTGADFVMTDTLQPWLEGDTWADHTDAVEKIELPTRTVTIRIKDTNPDNEAYRSVSAQEGVEFSFDVRYPMEAPVVNGVLRDEKASRNADGYPLLVTIGSLSEEQQITLNNNGYAYISVNATANPDSGELSVYEMLYPPQNPIVPNDNVIENEYAVDSGDLMHSGWAASRALDALENYKKLSAEEKAQISDVTLPDIDTYSAAVTGCSHNGKRAIITGVFDTGDNGDTRFDIICPSDPGGGGLTGFRYSTEGQLFSYNPPVTNGAGGTVVHDYAYGLNESVQRAVQNTSEDQWFGDRAQIFTVRPDLSDNTPFDLHELAGLFASADEDRYFIVWTGEAQDAWLSSPSTVLNTMAAKEIFEYLGQGDNIAYIVRDQAHANQDRDLPDLIAIMDHAFYGEEKIIRKFHDTLTSSVDHLTAADGSGTILPEKEFSSVAEMTRNPYYIPSAYMNWSRPDKHTLWTESNSVTEGVAMTFALHTDAQKVSLLLTDGETRLEAETVDGVAYISLTAEQAKAGQYAATAIGDKDEKTIEICGFALNDALRHSLSDNSALGHDVGTGICFTTPLVNYNSQTDAPKLYLNGESVPTDLYDYDNKITLESGETVPQSGYLQPYGATLTLYADTMGAAVPMGEKIVFSLRNAKIEALQGFVISMDVELEKYEPSAGRQRFKPTYTTLTAQTPVWQPDLLQNTPQSGLPAGETRWPMLGCWRSDYDEQGVLKALDEIRPVLSEKTECAYSTQITLTEADENGLTIAFSAPVSTKDFAVAINHESDVTFLWAEDCCSVHVSFARPAQKGDKITCFVFRSVDAEGNMIGEPVALNATL